MNFWSTLLSGKGTEDERKFVRRKQKKSTESYREVRQRQGISSICYTEQRSLTEDLKEGGGWHEQPFRRWRAGWTVCEKF